MRSTLATQLAKQKRACYSNHADQPGDAQNDPQSRSRTCDQWVGGCRCWCRRTTEATGKSNAFRNNLLSLPKRASFNVVAGYVAGRMNSAQKKKRDSCGSRLYWWTAADMVMRPSHPVANSSTVYKTVNNVTKRTNVLFLQADCQRLSVCVCCSKSTTGYRGYN